VDRKYHTVLEWAIRRPWAVVAVALLVFFGSLSTLGVMGTEFVPVEDRGEFVVNIEAPPGTSFEQSTDYVAEVESGPTEG
jgi:hydrophobic/amphiphilic exporter-1 (mainly G- bacteria), HAE1 family